MELEILTLTLRMTTVFPVILRNEVTKNLIRFLRFFADAQNDIVGVGGFRRPDICRLPFAICRLNCHNPSDFASLSHPLTAAVPSVTS